MIGKNNVFNIRFSKSNNWKGQIGQTRGFVDFDTVEHCVRAALILMRTYNSLGLVSVESVISRFAPRTENATDRYISYVKPLVFANLGFDFSLNDYFCQLLAAMSIVENGFSGRLSADYINSVRKKYHIVYE